MNVKSRGSERRASARFSVNDGILAIHANKPGRILDISKGGVSFEYCDGEEWPEGDLTLDILYGEKDFYLDFLPVKTVEDHSARNPGKGIHRRRLQFGSLSAGQQKQLNYFLKINGNCKKAS